MSEKIVVLDGFALNPGDLDWSELRRLGSVDIYDTTGPDDLEARSAEATVLLTNKTPLPAAAIAALPNLRFIGVLATGHDVVDSKAAAGRGIPVSNIPAYGTDSVAQFTIALLLELCHHAGKHSDDVRDGGWVRRGEWSYHLSPLVELSGKTLGIIGYGRIGRQVATIGRALGMKTVAAARRPIEEEGVQGCSVEDLLRAADVVSLHCPLTPETRHLINAARLKLMKPSSFLLNTSRGALIDEQALADALEAGQLAGAAVDVLPVEPPRAASPLMSAPNCIVTPHLAWATKEARARLMATAVENVRAFFAGSPVNVINGVK